MNMTRKTGREQVGGKRFAEEQEISRLVQSHGRRVLYRAYDMNVRTFVWGRDDGQAEVLIEQIRLYSSPGDWAFTRLMEASDLLDASRGLRKAKQEISSWRLPPLAPVVPRKPDRDAILWAIRRGEKKPLKIYLEGSVATLVWGNPTMRDDMTFKIEQLAVLNPESCPAHWHVLRSFQLEDAIKGYEQARDFIVETQCRLCAA